MDEPSAARRQDLHAFLAACRARLRPEDVGLPATNRRRTPGLRREEVAELAGVSLNWYASYETGTEDRHVSVEFVNRVADALLLDGRERLTLFRLSLPEMGELAEHFDIALADADGAVYDAQAAAGKARATTIVDRLMAEAAIRETRAVTGRVLSDAIVARLIANEKKDS